MQYNYCMEAHFVGTTPESDSPRYIQLFIIIEIFLDLTGPRSAAWALLLR